MVSIIILFCHSFYATLVVFIMLNNYVYVLITCYFSNWELSKYSRLHLYACRL